MLQVAKVLKSNGTEGGILIGLIEITFDQLDPQEPVFIEFDGLPVPFFFDSLEQKGSNRAIVNLTGVHNLKDSEELVGKAVFADYFEEEEDCEDFTGWTLIDKGRTVGTVSGVEAIPGNPCLTIEIEGQEILVPLAEELIVRIDEKGKTLEMDLPDGLV